SLDHNRGVWSLFRLLDELQVDYHSDRDVLLLKADLGGMRAHYLLHSQRSPNPFDLILPRGFSLPARLCLICSAPGAAMPERIPARSAATTRTPFWPCRNGGYGWSPTAWAGIRTAPWPAA